MDLNSFKLYMFEEMAFSFISCLLLNFLYTMFTLFTKRVVLFNKLTHSSYPMYTNKNLLRI